MDRASGSHAGQTRSEQHDLENTSRSSGELPHPANLPVHIGKQENGNHSEGETIGRAHELLFSIFTQ